MTFDELVKISPFLSFCTALLSALVAFSAFIYTRRANRRRATLDMVMKSLLDEDSRKVYVAFKAVVSKDQDSNSFFKLASLVDQTSDNIEDRNAVLAQLNIYELIALGVNRGVFDEHFYKRWFHGQFTKDYASSASMLDAIREKRPSVYCEYQSLHLRWMRKKHPVSHPSRLKMAYWTLRKLDAKVDAARASMSS